MGFLMECFACGREITNDVWAPNAAAWTLTEPRRPYCADNTACRRDAETAGVELDDVERTARLLGLDE